MRRYGQPASNAPCLGSCNAKAPKAQKGAAALVEFEMTYDLCNIALWEESLGKTPGRSISGSPLCARRQLLRLELTEKPVTLVIRTCGKGYI